MDNDSQILIGEVSGCFGVKGWIKVFSYCNPRENITTYKSWIVGNKHFDSVESKKNGKLIVAKLVGVDDKEGAQILIGQKVTIMKTQLSSLAKDQYYWHDLVGLQVLNTDGISFGLVKSILETGANDVVIVKGERERLIPYIKAKTIIKIDLKQGTMLVNWHEDD